jgi:acyl transferase domain-containing protein/acyl-CoA thioesterase FadM/NAD(P)-dependent dehydrogenase (short-subunit alcohol dehydrogenase family)
MFFATPYAIHFDDTMAYGSHHFLTGFKFQCSARESLLYGDLIYDRPGVPEALDTVHLFTADAYCRNLRPAYLGDRLVILLSLEEWGSVSARFCYRVLNQRGDPICAGFQNHVCADPATGKPIPLPDPLQAAFDEIREITERQQQPSFRDCVLMGSERTIELFTEEIREVARGYLTTRHPIPQIVRPDSRGLEDWDQSQTSEVAHRVPERKQVVGDQKEMGQQSEEVWIFPGQGAFDAQLLSQRIGQCIEWDNAWRQRLEHCAQRVQVSLESSNETSHDIASISRDFFSGSVDRCRRAAEMVPDLIQVGIYLQGVFGGYLRSSIAQPSILLGHSLGELAALTIAGSMSLEEGVTAVCQRTRSVRELGPKHGGLVAVMAGRPTVSEELAIGDFPGIVIAGRNHEGQTIVSGPRDQLFRFRDRLHELEIRSAAINSPTSFHHPSLQAASAAWRRNLEQIAFDCPSIAVYSPIGRRLIGDNDDLALVLSSQLVRPFDLQGAVDDLALAGFRQLVDCGSSGVLTRLLREIAPESMTVINAESNGSELPPLASPPANGPAVVAPPRPKSEPKNVDKTRPLVAIVGQGCLLPGGANCPEELHETLVQGRSGIVDLRDADSNWDRDFFSSMNVADRSTSALAGKVADTDLVVPANVDAPFFNTLSRAQKLLCISIAQCLDALRSSERILVLVGATADGFEDQDRVAALRLAGIDPDKPDLRRRLNEHDAAYQSPYQAIKMVLDRLIHPDVQVTLVDAACASSLYSVALGMSALENDEADLVLAGGIYCPGPGNNCLFAQFGGLTSTGSRPFDASADGVVFSEGAAFVALRRLKDAKALDQYPLAIVRGVGLSSDGRSPSANVPQSLGQTIAIERCFDNYRLSPATISAIEGHGTSTPAGDSTEVRSLSRFFASHHSKPLPLHSLKGLLGHTGWAAGTAAMIAATQMLKARTFPAQANFRSPSSALSQAADSLFVPTQPIKLPNKRCRIAIDGFGFGGANAHLVMESIEDWNDLRPFEEQSFESARQPTLSDEEPVVVACHRIDPATFAVRDAGSDSVESSIGSRRPLVPLPPGTIVLPDLAEDMDISQRLALQLVGETFQRLGGVDPELRSQTSLVFAMGGKTERGMEATLRVLANRFAREWEGMPEAELVRQVNDRARPSGPYTLQCMMPNVATGRAALQFNLNGPNFVVDAGCDSLEAAITAAVRLLKGGPKGGTQLAIVGAIHANQWSAAAGEPRGENQPEYATALAVTTRGLASQMGFDVIHPVDAVMQWISPLPIGNGHSTPQTTAQKLRALFQRLEGSPPSSRDSLRPSDLPQPVETLADGKETSESSPESLSAESNIRTFFLHAPQWAEAPIDYRVPRRTLNPRERCLVIAPARQDLVEKMLGELAEFHPEYWLMLVGRDAASIADRLALANVEAIESLDERAEGRIAASIDRFTPQLILAIAEPTTWDSVDLVRSLIDNSLCEALFVATRHLASPISQGQVEVYAAFPSSWNGVIHPLTGPIVGMLKAVQREMPNARVGAVGHRSDSLSKILRALAIERSIAECQEPEVVYDGENRLARRLRALPSGRPGYPVERKLNLDSNSVVLATGGARGVTAIMVESLLRDYGCTVIAWGRSPLLQGPSDSELPTAEKDFYARFLSENPGASPAAMRECFLRTQASWETVRRIEELDRLPGSIRYIPVDVNDTQAVKQAIAAVQSEFGRLDLIVHGAGVQFSKRLQDRKIGDFRKTFGIKVGGLANLVDACQESFGRIAPVHALTSAYSIFGNDGQHDYGAANETLDRLCEVVTRRGDTTWSSLAWSAWNGIGMTRGSEYRALAVQRNLALLEPPEGQEIFRRVIVGDTGQAIHVPLSQSERTRYRVRSLPCNPVSFPANTIELALPLSGMDYLEHHRAGGVPTLPGAWIVEQMVRAILRLAPEPIKYVTVENIRFRRFVRVRAEHDRRFRIIADATAEGYFAWLVGDIISPKGIQLTGDEVFASAFLSITKPMGLESFATTDRSHFQNGSRMTVSDPYCNGSQSVQLSGPFECLQDIIVDSIGRQATFNPKIDSKWHDVVPSLLLDASIRVAGMHAVKEGLHVPTEIKKVVLPIGVSTQSLDSAEWKIQASPPVVLGDEVRCGRVQVLDAKGAVRMLIEDAVVTKIS